MLFIYMEERPFLSGQLNHCEDSGRQWSSWGVGVGFTMNGIHLFSHVTSGLFGNSPSYFSAQSRSGVSIWPANRWDRVEPMLCFVDDFFICQLLVCFLKNHRRIIKRQAFPVNAWTLIFLPRVSHLSLLPSATLWCSTTMLPHSVTYSVSLFYFASIWCTWVCMQHFADDMDMLTLVRWDGKDGCVGQCKIQIIYAQVSRSVSRPGPIMS